VLLKINIMPVTCEGIRSTVTVILTLGNILKLRREGPCLENLKYPQTVFTLSSLFPTNQAAILLTEELVEPITWQVFLVTEALSMVQWAEIAVGNAVGKRRKPWLSSSLLLMRFISVVLAANKCELYSSANFINWKSFTETLRYCHQKI
jgi:hypothetical protein